MIKNRRIFYLSITILGIYIVLFLYFKPPWGLMDDYRFVYLIPELLNDFLFVNFEIISSRAFDRGMFQPFLVLQQFIQYMPGYLTLPYISYLFNLLIVFLCHFYFYKGFNRFIEIRYSVSVFVFFIWPFTNDLLFLISLQEKFIFLVGGLLLYKIRESSNYFLVFLATLSLPLIKLQGSIFLFIFLAIYLIEKKTIWLTGALGLATGIIIQAYFIFFNQGDYFVYDSNFEKLFNNLVVKEHLFVILISFTLIFLSYKKNKTEIIFIFGFVLSFLSLIFIYSNWNLYGYLFASYGFFLSVFFPLVEKDLLRIINLQKLELLIFVVLLASFFSSVFLFFMPRAERWSDLGSTIKYLSEDASQKSIYYCGVEGTRWLSELNLSHEFKFVQNPSDISEENFYIIKDDYNCNYFTDSLIDLCKLKKANVYQDYGRFYLLEANCIK